MKKTKYKTKEDKLIKLKKYIAEIEKQEKNKKK